jgi:hypothetical protein
MIERQSIGGRDVWIRVNPHPVDRPNPNIIPTEYFTADYFLEEPVDNQSKAETIKAEDGSPRLFESPVAALSHVRKQLERILRL